MLCRKLRLRDFRNFTELEVALPPAGVAIIGDNGEGKTNLVEAIYYLEIFRSFRGSPDDHLVRRGAEVFHLRGVFEDPRGGGAREISVGYERRSRRKKVLVDGVEPERIGAAIGGVGAVVFSPTDLDIITGAPGERRRFLDILLSLAHPGYLAALQRYRKLLRQRNTLLREGAPDVLIAPWDEGLIESGSQVTIARWRWIEARNPGFERRYGEIAGGTPGRMIYSPSIPAEGGASPVEVDEVAAAFRAELDRLARRERERRVTLVGPHRDELKFVMERDGVEIDLREFGSGGQQRTAAIALRMVEAETMRVNRKSEPMILLDDIFAELDVGRSRRILDLLEAEERGQVILTAPKKSDLEVRRGIIPHWNLKGGRLYQ